MTGVMKYSNVIMMMEERVSTRRILLMCAGAKALSPMRLHAWIPVEEVRNSEELTA